MDSLTHTVLGACLGEAIAGKQLGKKAMLIGALANNFPDIDVISHFFTSPAQELLAHRGITHSILCCTVLSFVFAKLLPKIFKKSDITFNRSLALIGSGLFLHILMDACTSYGTGWFEPFSHYRVSFNTLFIIDPLFLLPLLIGTIILLVQRKNSASRFKVSTTVLTLSAIYLAITICIKAYVTSHINSDLKAQHISHNDYMVTPTPLNNLLWNVVTKNDSNSYIGYYSVFDKNPRLDYAKINKRDSLLGSYRNAEEVKMLQRFSKGYYCLTQSDSSVVFNDLRFGQIGGWYDRDAPFVFTFDITRKNDATHIQQGRMKAVGPEPLKQLAKRIQGN